MSQLSPSFVLFPFYFYLSCVRILFQQNGLILNFLQFVTAKFTLREILTKEQSRTEQAHEWKQKHSSKLFHPGSDWTDG